MLRAALAPAIAGHWSIVTDESPHGLAIACQVLFFGDGNTKREKAYTKVSGTPRITSARATKSDVHLDVRFASNADMCDAKVDVR
jgi:hypothetical protein